MSQEKVARYKEDKANRKELMKKAKMQKTPLQFLSRMSVQYLISQCPNIFRV